jgi:hypothetical protein
MAYNLRADRDVCGFHTANKKVGVDAVNTRRVKMCNADGFAHQQPIKFTFHGVLQLKVVGPGAGEYFVPRIWEPSTYVRFSTMQNS